jgi:integrase/recombinase XerC
MSQPLAPSAPPGPPALIADDADRLSGPIRAWLAAKAGRTGSLKTRRAYAATLASLRAALQAVGSDLDSDHRAVALVAQAWAAGGDPAPATFNQRLAIASSFYTFVERRGLLATSNPIRLVDRRPVQAYAGAEALDLPALQARLQAIDRATPRGLRDFALLAIFLQTGRRLSEVAALRGGDLQLAGERITLVFRRTKGGKLMRDTLPPATAAALRAWLHARQGAQLAQLPAETPLWVSLSRNGTAGRALSIRAIATICEARLGVSKVHALRHTFARAMEQAGARVSAIQARLGHSSLATTGRYLAALRADENEHGAALERMFGLGEG